MSSTASPTLNLFVNAAPVVESASATADGTRCAIAARKSSPAWNRALTPLFSCGGRRPQHRFAGAQRRDDQFGQVPQGGVEQSADRVARLGSHGLGGMTQ